MPVRAACRAATDLPDSLSLNAFGPVMLCAPSREPLPEESPVNRAPLPTAALALAALLGLAGCGDDAGGGATAGAGAGAAKGKDSSLCALTEQEVGEIVKQELKPPVVEPDGSGCRYLPPRIRDGKEIVVTLKAWPPDGATRVRRAIVVPEIGAKALIGDNGSRGTAITQFPHGDQVVEVSLGATGFEPTKELRARSVALGTVIAERLGAAEPVTDESGPHGVEAGREMCSVMSVADVSDVLGIELATAKPLVRSLKDEMCTYRTATGKRPYSEVTITASEPESAGEEPGDGQAVPELGPGAAAGTWPLGAWAQFPTVDDRIVEITWSSPGARSPDAPATLTKLATQVRDSL
jgi:hypothetical protein